MQEGDGHEHYVGCEEVGVCMRIKSASCLFEYEDQYGACFRIRIPMFYARVAKVVR